MKAPCSLDHVGGAGRGRRPMETLPPFGSAANRSLHRQTARFHNAVTAERGGPWTAEAGMTISRSFGSVPKPQ